MTPETRHDRLLIQEVGDELVVYDQERHRVHRLNKTAALVWRHCDGQTTREELAALLQSEAGLPADQELVRLALARLAKARLLKWDERQAEPTSVTRRQVIRKLGLVGALTLLLPAVTSVTAPTPAMAQTVALVGAPMCAAAGGFCTTAGQCRTLGKTNIGALDCPAQTAGTICCA